MKAKRFFIFALALFMLVFFQFGELFFKIFSKLEYNNVAQSTGEEIVGEIYGSKEIGQSFISKEDNISSIEVLMGNFNRNNMTTIEYGIKELKTGNELDVKSELEYHEEDAFLIKDNGYHKFKFNNLKNSKGKAYYFYIRLPEANSENSITAYKSKSNTYNEGNLFIDGIKQNSDLTIKINSKVAYPKTYMLLIVFVGIVAMLLLWYIINSSKELKIEKIFAIITLTYGIFMTFVMPPFQAPDEPVHFYRAFEVSQGGLISTKTSEGTGSYLPRSIRNIESLTEVNRIAFNPKEKVNFYNYKKAIKEPLNKEDKMFYNYPSAAVYAPVQYMPQSIGIAVGRLFNLPILMVFYLGRIANLLIWTLLISWSLKIMPSGKNILAIIALLPMCIQQAASISPDALLNAAAILFIALTLKYNKSKEPLNIQKKSFLFSIAAFITLSKIVYLPIVLLLFLLPKESFKSKTRYISYIVFVGLASTLITALWLKFVNSQLGLNFAPFLGVNTSKQIKYALTHPFRYALIMRNTLYDYAEAYITGAIGNLGWLDTMLPYSVIYSFLFTSIFVSATSDLERSNKLRGLSFFIFISSTVLILSSLYAGWTPVAQEFIVGVQGRYFIPLLPLLLIFIPNLKINTSIDNINKYMYIYVNWVFLYTILILVERYYIL